MKQRFPAEVSGTAFFMEQVLRSKRILTDPGKMLLS